MAAIDHHAGVVIGQVDVPGKTNEISMFSQLCDLITDLDGVVVTADAMHCQKDHADYLVLQRGAHYVLTVKGNQPALRHQLKALPWKDVPVGHTSHSRGHGRVEQRTLKVVTVSTGILFPHAAQTIQITRRTRKLNDKKWRTEIFYAVTSLTAAQPPMPSSRPRSAATGAWRTVCTGFATSPSTRPLPGPHRQRPSRHGHPAQPRHQPSPPGRCHQHRPSPSTSRMGPT